MAKGPIIADALTIQELSGGGEDPIWIGLYYHFAAASVTALPSSPQERFLRWISQTGTGFVFVSTTPDIATTIANSNRPVLGFTYPQVAPLHSVRIPIAPNLQIYLANEAATNIFLAISQAAPSAT